MKEFTDSIVIFAAIIIDTIVGYIQEAKASKALSELKKVLSIQATVFRNGNMLEVSAQEIVPGDIVVLKPGDKVPADGRIIESHNLKVNESVFTGEWLPASKSADIVLPKDTPLADRDNMVYMGTAIEEGQSKFIVTDIGINTEIGKINRLVGEIKEEKTPYQKKIAQFSKLIGIIIGIICAIIFIQGIITGGEFAEMFTTAVAIAVASIPEGLPVATTVILAFGMQNILKRKGLVRKLAATETLGSTSIIATDKTGTLTEAKMTVAGIYTLSPGEENSVLKNAILCSEAFIENPNDQPENWLIRGMPTERALVLFGAKSGLLKEKFNKTEPQIDEIPFSSEYKYSASLRKIVNAGKEEENIIYIKGAPEIILEKSKFLKTNKNRIEIINEDQRILLNKKYKELAEKAYRVLGVAYKKTNKSKIHSNNLNNFIDDLVFNGFVYFEDPLRKEAKEAIQLCQQAGIRPIIVTGDHKLTAKAIAKKLGLNIKEENILEGKDLEKISDSDFDKKLRNIQIYARVEPKHKLRIIKAWQQKEEVIAMTGDGVNDAPALKQADIGVALGSGTEVAKEVSDLVLLTDNFSVIVATVEEGRAILDNIRKVITYLLSDSFTEIILISSAIIAESTIIEGLPLPVTAVQILWINLIEDGLPDIALAFEPKEKDLMKLKPESRKIPLLTKEMKIIIFIVGLITDLILVWLFFWLWSKNHNIEYIQTMVFACLAIDSISYVFCCKSLRKNLWNSNLFNNKLLIGAWFLGIIGVLAAIYIPSLNKLLGTIPLSFSDWRVIGGLAIINVALIEFVKYYFIQKDKKI